MGDLACTPPHDILDQEIEPHQPHGASADPVNELMLKSREVLAQHPVNQKRIDAGKPPATQIWLWGQGTEPAIQPYDQRIGLAGGVITAVDLIRGIGKLAGLRVIEVEGATGLPDTNFEGKAQAALDVLQEDDFVCIHVEATDEMGHQGDLELKTQSARDFDQRLVRHVVEGLNERGEAFRILVLPDHPTPLSLRTHTREPVPFLLYDSRNPAQQGSEGYSEIAVRNRSSQLVWGYRLLDALAEKNSLQEIEVNQPAA
jgi:2,3-bisphosphoglycerate-independent phosphoglycerate mutase